MWVRSQNGQKLLKVNHIGVETSPKDFGIVAYGLHSYVILGTYVCGDQAYGIMDEIQMRLNEGCPQVYQMPEDIDVLELARTKREEVERAIEKFKSGFKGEIEIPFKIGEE